MQLDIKNLIVDRGPRRVIDGLSFSLSDGETVMLLGSNGSGKSTLIRAIAGFINPVAGSITLSGDVKDPDAPRAESCHFIGHLNGAKSSLTVRENLRFWSHYFAHRDNDDPIAAVDKAMTTFNLADLADIPSGYLSQGQRRRLALARLLVAKRPLWLLDEPTVSLDSQSVTLLATAIAQHARDGGLTIAATHIPLGLDDARELRLEMPKVAP